MAKSSITGGNPAEAVHTRTSGGAEDSQVAVLGIDGSDSVVPADIRGVMVRSGGTAISDGRTTIATAGAAAQLNGGTSVPCKAVLVTALPANTLRVAVGSSAVDASDAGLRGAPLEALESITLEVDDVNKIYLDVLVNAEGVTWLVLA